MEQMTVSEALDERDFLEQKIKKAIKNLEVITVKRQKDPATKSGKSVESFKNDGKATYQSIVDQIDRYRRINVAITMSNANTKIKLRSGIEMTVAEAIARKKMLADGQDIELLLLKKMATQNEEALINFDRLNNMYESQRRDMMNSLITSTHVEKLDENQVKSVETMVSGAIPEIIDALSTNDKSTNDIVNDMSDQLNSMVKQINSAIKISNATTVIEF